MTDTEATVWARAYSQGTCAACVESDPECRRIAHADDALDAFRARFGTPSAREASEEMQALISAAGRHLAAFYANPTSIETSSSAAELRRVLRAARNA